MSCQYAANCPPPPPPPHGGIGTAVSFHGLPMTGAELLLYVIVALAIIAAGVTIRVYARSKA
jgi:hypothetical protein